MSTWICDLGHNRKCQQGRVFGPSRAARFFVSWVLFLSLIGCSNDAGGAKFGFSAPETRAATANKSGALQSASLANGRVVVRGPVGYCIDRKALKRGSTSGFALLAACDALSGDPDSHSVAPAIMTVQVLARGLNREQPSASDLTKALAPAKILSDEDGDGLTLVHVASGGNQGMPSGDPRYWRGAMVINGHIVGLAVYGFKGGAISGTAGRASLIALAESLRQSSPVRDYSAEAKNIHPNASRNSPAPKGFDTVMGKLFPKLPQ